MNWMDFTALAMMLSGAALGWFKGLLRGGFILAGSVVAPVIAGQFYAEVSSPIEGIISNDALRQIVAFSAVFICVILIAVLLAGMLKKALTIVLLGWVDNASGMAFGFFSGFLIAAAFIWAFGIVPSEFTRETVRESILAGPIIGATSFLLAFLPPEFESFRQALDRSAALYDLTTGQKSG